MKKIIFKIKKINKILIILFLMIIIIYFNSRYNYKKNVNYSKVKENNDNIFFFKYYNYQREIINNRIKKFAHYELTQKESYFLNGIIRKLKPKNCLEIGTSSGGSAILILNAIKDINDSILVSMDLNNKFYKNKSFNTGYRVKTYFPNLANKWKLFTGNYPHKFLDKLKMKFEFLFLDTVHSSPGEIINLIEVLPFLKEKAVIVLHDINYHNLLLYKLFNNSFPKKKYYKFKFHPSNIYLFTVLYGDKIIIKNKISGIENIGAIFLYQNQKKYYLDYFLLLLSPWEYMPNNKMINDLRDFIKKYYKEEIYLLILNKAIEYNKIYLRKINN